MDELKDIPLYPWGNGMDPENDDYDPDALSIAGLMPSRVKISLQGAKPRVRKAP